MSNKRGAFQIAAMGLFSPLEFKRKYAKKKVFTFAFNMLGCFQSVYWSATSDMEVAEIMKEVKIGRERIFIAEDLPRIVDATPIHKEKIPGELRVVWISRIAPKKNLLGTIDILKVANGNVSFTIYGPVHDKEYWQKCKVALKALPSNIVWEYKGNVDSESVVETLKPYHVFLFPTLGENYGHVIQEALSAGCACILSDQTPWQDLEKNGVGYVFPISEMSLFVRAIDYFINLDNGEIQKIADGVQKYAISQSNAKVNSTGYRLIFDKLTR